MLIGCRLRSILHLSIVTASALLISCAYNPPSSKRRDLNAKPQANKVLGSPRQVIFLGKRSGEGYFDTSGENMVFQSEVKSNNPFYQIFTINLKNGKRRMVSTGEGKTTCSYFDAKSERVVFSSTHLDPKTPLLMKKELEARELGRTQKYSWDYDPHYDLFIRDLKSNKLKRITQDFGYDAEASFSPDGKFVLYASNAHAYRSKSQADDLKSNPSRYIDLFLLNLTSRQRTQLTAEDGYDGGPFFNSAGTHIVWRHFAPDGHSAEVWVMDLATQNKWAVTKLNAMSWAPFFHPSGDYIVFTTNRHGYDNFELYIVDTLAQHEPVRISDLPGFDGLPVFHPSGLELYWTRTLANSTTQIVRGTWNDMLARKLLGLAPANQSTPLAPALVKAASPKLEDLKEQLSFLASRDTGGRETGSAGERIAHEYIAGRWLAAGLRPWGGDNKTFFQPFQFTSQAKVADASRLEITNATNKKALALPLGLDFTPLAGSQTGRFSTKNLVDAGYGLVAPKNEGEQGYDAYPKQLTKDAWVIIRDGLPADMSLSEKKRMLPYARWDHKVLMAKKAGAKGIIKVLAPNESIPLNKQRILPMAPNANAQNLPLLAVTQKASEKIADNTLTLTADIQIEHIQTTAYNLVGHVPVKSPTRRIIIGAHGDHLGTGHSSRSLITDPADSRSIHYGADDNASGMTVLIELAQWLKSNAHKKFQNTELVFAIWSGEELGNLGSSAFIKKYQTELAKLPTVYINFDMVGRYTDSMAIQAADSSPAWSKLIEAGFIQSRLSYHIESDPFLPTDALSFYLNRFPVQSFFTGVHDDYHKPQDTADKINYAALSDFIEDLKQYLPSVAQNVNDIKYQEVTSKNVNRRRGFRVYLGTIPDYANNQSPGVRLSGVIKGGPAEQAGLKAHDILLKFKDIQIQNLEDYVSILEILAPGEATPVEYRRGTKVISTLITPASRR